MSALAVGPPTPVQICQLEAEFLPVLELYRDKHPASVLEIGTASGGTLYHWLTAGAEDAPPQVVVSVDLPDPDYDLDRDACLAWAPAGVTCVLVEGNSHDHATIEQVREHAPYDWLFVDGCHVYDDARADFDTYRPMVCSGGIVLLHDIALRRRYEDGRSAGVWRLWQELRQAGYWTREFRADPSLAAYGIGALRVP